jgi:hypothetical protein
LIIKTTHQPVKQPNNSATKQPTDKTKKRQKQHIEEKRKKRIEDTTTKPKFLQSQSKKKANRKNKKTARNGELWPPKTLQQKTL